MVLSLIFSNITFDILWFIVYLSQNLAVRSDLIFAVLNFEFFLDIQKYNHIKFFDLKFIKIVAKLCLPKLMMIWRLVKIYGKCLRTLIMIRPRTCIWIFFINLYLIAKDNISKKLRKIFWFICWPLSLLYLTFQKNENQWLTD